MVPSFFIPRYKFQLYYKVSCFVALNYFTIFGVVFYADTFTVRLNRLTIPTLMPSLVLAICILLIL
jgi:hypothetical protein